MPDKPWRIENGRLILRVRLTPRSSRDALEGIGSTAEGPAVKARVRAVPEDGKANAALEALLADVLDVPKSAVTVSAGAKSRIKLLAILGDVRELIRRVEIGLGNSA